MKKCLLAILTGIFFFSAVNAATAGTVGNPISTDIPKGKGIFSLKGDRQISLRGGLDTEILFDRDLKATAGSSMQITSAEWYMGRISWSMFDRIEPYIKLGIAHFKTEWTELSRKVKLESESKFAWSLGLKTLLWEFQGPQIKLIADGYYRMADLDAEKGWYNSSKVTIDTSRSQFTIREWQIALAAATEIDVSGNARGEFLGVSSIVPYAGVKYSDLNGRIREHIADNDYHNPGDIEADNIFGVFTGCDFVGPNDVVLNLEGRFIDETGITVGLSALF